MGNDRTDRVGYPDGTGDAPEDLMIEVSASIDIAAPAQAVWDTLTDLRRFREWNPFIRKAWGSLHTGKTVRVRVRSRIGMPMFFRAKVLSRQGRHELRWRGHFLTRWLASGEHTFTLETLATGVRFAQREVFTGILPWLARGLLVRETQRGFDAMNRALKERVEDAQSASKRSPTPSSDLGAT